MIFLWIPGILLAIFLFIYLRLMLKRIRLLTKLKRIDGCNIEYLRFPLRSVFIHDGAPDLLISVGGRRFAISIFTTRFHRVRYHFMQNEGVDIMMARKPIWMLGTKYIARSNLFIQTSFKIRRKTYKTNFDFSKFHHQEAYVLLHPAPIEISKVEGSRILPAGNNDIIFDNVRISGLSYFIHQIIKKEPYTE